MTDQKPTTECQRIVLIGVDGSGHSERAFNFYLNVIYRNGDLVVIFHAQAPPSMPAHYTLGFPYDEFQKVMDKADEDAKTLLKHFGTILKTKLGSSIQFKLIKEHGQPGELICKNITEEKATVVVLGTRGQGTVRRTILGSISDYVVHHSHVPVCVVPPVAKS